MNHGPPELFSSTDSEDEDGLMYGGDYDDFGEKIRRYRQPPTVSREDELAQSLRKCLDSGDMVGFKEIWNANDRNLDINAQLRSCQWTPLMIACQGHYMELVDYILSELNADPNASPDDYTPLILACIDPCSIFALHNGNPPDDELNALRICQWLLCRGAMVNKATNLSETPLMFAAQSGYVSVIELLLQKNAAKEAKNNEDETAIFYAVKNNRYDATKALIEAGAIVETVNRFGDTPKSIAQDNGFDSLLDFFPPDPIVEFVPSNFSNYNTYIDLIPTAFPDQVISAYSPDVCTMLDGMRVANVKYEFYEAQISLSELLTITNDRLREIGIEFPYHRNRILLGILKFHEKSWSKDSLSIPKQTANVQDYFHMLSNGLRQMIVIESTLKFIEKHPIFAAIAINEQSQEIRQQIYHELSMLRENVLGLLQCFQNNQTLAPPPPLHIDQNKIRDALNPTKTFRAQLIRKMNIISCIGIGIAAFAVIRAHFR